MKKVKKISGVFIFVAIVAAVIVLFSSIVVTKENEYSVIKRFGKIERVNDKAGISLKSPFVEEVYSIPKSIQFYNMPESDVITMDKKTMVADSYVLWKIEKPIIFAQTLSSSVVKAEGRINTTVYNAIKLVIGRLSQAEVISGRDGKLDGAFMESIGNAMDQYGIKLISVETKHLDLPNDNKVAVFERMISERAQIAATYTATGTSQAQKIQNETDKEVAISISDAKAKAAKITAEGESEYMKILSAAYSDKARSEFYTYVRALDAAKKSLTGDNKTLILSPDSPITKIFYNLN